MVRKTALIAFALVSSPAAAQSTDCRWVGSTWSCNTPPSVDTPSAPNDYLGAMGGAGPNYDETVRKQRAIKQNRDALARQEKKDAARTSIALKLRERDCAGAIDEALSTGDIALASDVQKFCAGMPKP